MTKSNISRELLKILVCPVCKGAVTLKGKELVCGGCKQRYPIVEGIPIMLPDEMR